MPHIVRNLPWCVIDLDTSVGRIFFQQRWRYSWHIQTGSGLSAWTPSEQWAFHNTVDRSIWSTWSYHVRFRVTGRAAFARRFRNRTIPMNLDIRRVWSNEHWNVRVTKIPAGTNATSSIFWNSRRIELDTNDVNPRSRTRGTPAVTVEQVPATHEFGHTIGNTVHVGAGDRGDEYPAGSANHSDRQSIMNIGMELRERHFRTIRDELNNMIPQCVFAVDSV